VSGGPGLQESVERPGVSMTVSRPEAGGPEQRAQFAGGALLSASTVNMTTSSAGAGIARPSE
jgi:hypothetical protein